MGSSPELPLPGASAPPSTLVILDETHSLLEAALHSHRSPLRGPLPMSAPPLRAWHETSGGTATIHVSGELDVSTVHELRAAIRAGMDQSVHHVIIDMTEVSFVDSAGVATLIGLANRLKARSLPPPMVIAGPDVRRIVSLIGVDKLLDITDRNDAPGRP